VDEVHQVIIEFESTSFGCFDNGLKSGASVCAVRFLTYEPCFARNHEGLYYSFGPIVIDNNLAKKGQIARY
jgi:hypothetical protein